MHVADVRDARQLWRLLVTVPAGRELPPAVAVDAFRRLHDAGQPEPVDSALLLCTDRRWKRTSAQVLGGIVATGILDDAEQDRLAEELLWPDQVRYTHPLGWFGNAVEIDLETGRQRKVRTDPHKPVTTERHVWPPLRTWAAERVLARKRATPADVLAHARALPARQGAAVVTGAVHATDQLEPAQARMVVDTAVEWPAQAPRKAALEQLIAWGEADRAEALAASDPDAAVREWGRKRHTDVPEQGDLFG